MEYIDIEVVKKADRDAGHHWFEPGAMRFFRSRSPQTVLKVGDRAYFVTSEQFVPSEGPPAPRLYTIRVYDLKTGSIETYPDHHTGWQKYRSGTQAMTDLKRILEEMEATTCQEPGPK